MSKPVFDKPMSEQEIIDFQEILAKSYKVNPDDIIWANDPNNMNDIIYYLKAYRNKMDVNKQLITDKNGKYIPEEYMRQIFTINISGK